MQVRDVVLFFNEVQLAQFRVEYLSDVVSHHYFFESRVSHSGKGKHLHLKDSGLFAGNSRVSVLEIPVPNHVIEKGSRWAIEEYSRDWAMWKIATEFPDDVILLTDVDEIPSREQVRATLTPCERGRVVTLSLDTHYRWVNFVSPSMSSDAKAFRGRDAKAGIRFLPAQRVPGQRGAHLRYLGYKGEGVREKHSAFAHAELDVTDLDHHKIIEFSDLYSISHLPRFDMGDFGLLRFVKSENLNEVALEFFRSYPELSIREPDHFPLWRRLLASYEIIRSYKGAGAKLNPEAPNSRGVKVALESVRVLLRAGFIVTQVPRVVRVGRRIVESVTRGSHPKGRKLLHLARGVYRFGDQISPEATNTSGLARRGVGTNLTLRGKDTESIRV